MEEWRPIEEFPNYAVSNEGRLFAWKTAKYLLPQKQATGHLYIGLYPGDGKARFRMVAKLVLTAFAAVPESDISVYFRDGNPENTKLSNLYWRRKTKHISTSKRAFVFQGVQR